MAVPTRPEANACSWAKNSKQNLVPERLSEKLHWLNGPAKGFAHSTA